MGVREDQHELAPCPWTGAAIVYAKGGPGADDDAAIERHISSCDACRQVLSAYARLVEPEVTDEEERLINSIEKPVIKAAVALYPKRPQPHLKGRSPWPALKRWWAPIAATVALASTLVLTFVIVINSKKSMLERGQEAYLLGVSQRRPLQYRITESPYAPYARLRGDAEQRQLTSAHFLLQTALSQEPAPQARHALGRVLLAKGDASAALEILSQASDEKPGDLGLRSDRAVALAETGNIEDALREFGAILNEDPRQPAALFNRTIINVRLGKPEQVAEDLRRLATIEPNSPWAAELLNQTKGQ